MSKNIIKLALVGGAAAFCTLDDNRTACEAPTTSSCTDTCALFKAASSCGTNTGCEWKISEMMGMTISQCTPKVSANCFSATSSAECTGLCTWQTLPCQFQLSCSGSQSACFNLDTEATCAANTACTWSAQCQQSTTCGIASSSKASCTGAAGCYWIASTNNGESSESCGECFTDFTKKESAYLRDKALVGQTCSGSFMGFPISASLTGVDAASGCDGGVPAISQFPAGITCSGVTSCTLNGNKTACVGPSQSSCVDTCGLSLFSSSCGANAGCEWKSSTTMGFTTSACEAKVSANCFSKNNAADCTGLCTWETLPCLFDMTCEGSDVACFTLPDATSCTANTKCTWEPQCQPSTTCGVVGSSKAACTGAAGCYWIVSTQNGSPATSCDECFDATKKDNVYLVDKTLVGQTCSGSIAGLSFSYSLVSVEAAASGCDGGATPRYEFPQGFTCSGSASLSLMLVSFAALFGLLSV